MKNMITAKTYIENRIRELEAERDVVVGKIAELQLVLDGIKRSEEDAALESKMKGEAPF